MDSETNESLRWHKFPVLDDGFVCLTNWMGEDADVVQAAKVSYGADKRLEPQLPNGDDLVSESEMENIAKRKEHRRLIRYLMRHRHTTPFEMCELKFLVRVPMDCWRQWIRTRTASVNEYSTRYKDAIDSQQKTAPDQWRKQATNNKQGSSGLIEEWPEGFIDKDGRPIGYDGYLSSYEGFKDEDFTTPGQYLSIREKMLQEESESIYKERLKFGVAREQARKDLPLSTYTEAYWKIDLHNLLHFLSLRMDSHAQYEIRQYAITIGNIVAKLFPLVWEAFIDYRLNSITLTAPELEALKDSVIDGGAYGFPRDASTVLCYLHQSDRENDEFEYKLARMGFRSDVYDGKAPYEQTGNT